MLWGAALLLAAGGCQATSCSLVVSALSFGVYDTTSPLATDTAATVEVACIPGLSDPLSTPYTLSIAGTGVANDTVRAINAGAYRLYYQIYADPARTQAWGNGSGVAGQAGTVVASAALVAGQQTHTAYARMAARQNVPPGLYSGSLLVTVDY